MVKKLKKRLTALILVAGLLLGTPGRKWYRCIGCGGCMGNHRSNPLGFGFGREFIVSRIAQISIA